MSRLVDRFGRTGFAALTSVAWALPMAAWAGSVDLTPIDRTAYPWVAFGIGVVMLVVWLAIVARLPGLPVSQRPHRLDLGQMSAREKRWMLALVVFSIGGIGWLNAAATVDWTPLLNGLAAGRPGAIALAAALGAFLAAMLGGAWWSWRRQAAAFAARAASSLSNAG